MRDPLADRVRATPDATALVDAADGTVWTYADVDRAAESVAGRLSALGVAPGDGLGVCLSTGPRAAVTVHAAARLGAVLVPLGPRLTPPELARDADRADVSTLVCDPRTESTVREAATAGDDAPATPVVRIGFASTPDSDGWTDGPGVDGGGGPAPGSSPRGAAPSRALSTVDPTSVAGYDWDLDESLCRLLTSGTTGAPKVVVVTPRMVVASAVASAFRLGVTPDDRWYDPLSVHHTGGLAPLYRAALYGTAVVVRDGFDAGRALADLREFDATGVSLVPTMCRRMLDAGEFPDSVRTVLLGGAPAPVGLLDDCRDRGVPVHPTYGTTETASQVATARSREAFDRETTGTVGRPLLWTRVTVVDEAGDPLPEGETGEVVVDGPTVTPGYYGDPAATEASFGSHGLHTGDVGRLVDGRLYVTGRLDDRIVSGGENVDPGEVTAVVRDHPAVAEVAVVGVPDPEWGQRVAALVVPVDDAPAVDDLIAHCRGRLAGFKRPRRWAFADALPRTASGTVERDAVRDLLVANRNDDAADPGGGADPGGA